MSLINNKANFLTLSSTIIKGGEMISTRFLNYDITGLESQLMSDPDFVMDLKIISAELDLSKYIIILSIRKMK